MTTYSNHVAVNTMTSTFWNTPIPTPDDRHVIRKWGRERGGGGGYYRGLVLYKYASILEAEVG